MAITAKTVPERWRNRIVRYEEVAPAQLLGNPKNWRIHSATQQQTMAALFDEIGWVACTIVNVHTGTIVDGHMRVQLAIAHDEPSVPVLYVDLTQAEEDKILALFDWVTGQAGRDKEHFDQLLRDIDLASPVLMAELDKAARSMGIVPGEPVERQPLFPGGSVAPLSGLAADGADPSSGLDGDRVGTRKDKTNIVLTFAPDAYPLVLARLDAVREAAGLDDNRDALLLLLDEWESANDAAVPY